MIGIYSDEFIQFLNDYLDPVQEKAKNIVCRCPWCELHDNDKTHYHLWISTETPMFHCFHSDCHKSGVISTLVKKLTGRDNSEKYIDRSKIKKKIQFDKGDVVKTKSFIIPDLNHINFKLKTKYIKQRMKYSNYDITTLRGMIFDVESFVNSNYIELDDKQKGMLPFLQTNFIGFLAENNSVVIFRNIDHNSSFRYYKIPLQPVPFSDYYKLSGYDIKSNEIIIAEGIFDILTEHIFDYINLRHTARLYAAGLSTHYASLIKSIVFNEQLYRPNVHILSDNGMDIRYYKKIKRENKHIINSMKVYYNKNGKDFNDTPVNPVVVNL